MIDFPKFSLGTWSMGGGDSWGECDDRESISTVHAALDLGVKWIDTAPAYGNGRSEELLGKALKGRRQDIILASKCGLVWDETGSMEHIRRDGLVVYRNLTPPSIRRQLEATLTRLDTDYLDLYITHHQNPNDSLEATIGCLEELKKEGKVIYPEIMVPLVGIINEFEEQKNAIVEAANALFAAEGDSVEYTIGTMIEIPRAALTADQIAQQAQFFSFGTNDLTQMTFGYSRDDVNSFLPIYLRKKILKNDPFQVLDQTGVGQLVEMATAKGRGVNPDLKCGICGEHGGEPESVKFCHRVGLNYVSCSPFRVPIARLAAAQAAVEEM